MTKRITINIAIISVLLSAFAMSGCQRWRNRNKPAPKAQISRPTVTRDIPSALRGTIGAEARISGVQQTLVSGIGFVVGLNGTGGLTIPEQYAAHLEREMGKNGVSVANDDPNSPMARKSPRELLRDPNTAAVIVQAAVPAGASEGESFDIYVRAINATSLEGGKLWTTDLRIGPPSAFGDPQARILGRSRGPIFLNPFAEPGGQNDGISRDVGRVLDGGTVTFPTQIEIILDNPSHQRARQIVSAINSVFPATRDERGQIARGKDESLIFVQIPKRYLDKRQEFIDLLSHITIDQSYPEIYARRYALALQSDPYLAGDMSLCLQALGERALPFISDLYDSPEAAPRFAALRAGAALDDARVVKPLREIALDTESRYRTDAIRLMGRLDRSLLVDTTLRELLEDKQLTVRVEAYETLLDRSIRSRQARAREIYKDQRSSAQIDALTRAWVPLDPIRGVGRELVADKFFLDVVPYGEPLIYITQQKEPRIVLFGDQISLRKPLLATAWSDRLMLAADSPSDPVRLYYRDDNKRTTLTINDVPTNLREMIKLMAHDPSPEDPRAGLSLSYSQVVGALYQIYADDGMRAAFTTEQDRLLADLIGSVQSEEITMRPESSEGDSIMVPVDDPTAPVVGPNEALKTNRRTLLVPVHPPSAEDETEEDTDNRLDDEPEMRAE